jgi:hypothetical protein
VSERLITLVAFARARLAEEEPGDACGCLDANHVPPCTPQPWKDRKRREISAIRAIADNYETCATADRYGPDPAPIDHFQDGLEWALRQLVTAWSDHPDYQPDLQ